MNTYACVKPYLVFNFIISGSKTTFLEDEQNGHFGAENLQEKQHLEPAGLVQVRATRASQA